MHSSDGYRFQNCKKDEYIWEGWQQAVSKGASTLFDSDKLILRQDSIIYTHCLDGVGINYIKIKDDFKLQPIQNREGWMNRVSVSICGALPHGACIFVRQLFDNIIIAMKQRPSRKPNHIFHPTDAPPQHPPPHLLFNPAKQPHQLGTPSQKVPTRDNAGLARVEASSEGVGELLEIYEWRAQTDYPVVRAWWRKVNFNQIAFTQSHKQQLLAFIKQNPLRSNAAIHVEFEPIRPLLNYHPLPINQFLYAYREALIAFERLFSLFGNYEISSQMIGVNAEGKVKVWLHPLYHLNNKIEGRHLQTADAEASILEGVRRVFAESSQESPTFRQFFEGAKEIRSFICFLRYIHDFSTSRRIIIASRVLKKQETPGNHPKRPLSPVAPFRPTSNYNNNRFNPHLSIAPSFITLAGYGPELALISRKSVKEPYHFQALETTETLNPLRARVSVEDGSSQMETAQYGKIVKNRLNMWLTNSKSHQNLPRFSPTPSIQRYLEPNSPNSIEKCMNRLFEDEVPEKFESKLMQLGRSVKESCFIQ